MVRSTAVLAFWQGKEAADDERGRKNHAAQTASIRNNLIVLLGMQIADRFALDED